MLSLKETAEKLGVHWKTLRSYCIKGKVKATKIGRDWKISEEEVAYILQHGTRNNEN